MLRNVTSYGMWNSLKQHLGDQFIYFFFFFFFFKFWKRLLCAFHSRTLVNLTARHLERDPMAPTTKSRSWWSRFYQMRCFFSFAQVPDLDSRSRHALYRWSAGNSGGETGTLCQPAVVHERIAATKDLSLSHNEVFFKIDQLGLVGEFVNHSFGIHGLLFAILQHKSYGQ